MINKNLLPSDTRTTEIISGVSLMIISLLIFLTGERYLPATMLSEHGWHFWGIVSGVFGAAQIGAVSQSDGERARAIMAWLSGSYWIWSGAHQLMGTQGHFFDAVSIVLGVSCMYAFVINLLLVTEKEEQHGNDAIA